MTFQRGNIGFFLLFIIIGAVLGSALGTLIVSMAPSLQVIVKNLTGPMGFDLEIISFTLKLNLSAIIGMVLGAVIFRKV
jgi:hypothetical protein